MKRIHRIHKYILEKNIHLIEDYGWDWFDTYSSKDVLYVDELNFIDCSGYTVINGVYKFYNRKTMFIYMHDYGITCGCERRLINGRVQLCYNGQPMTKEQYNYLSKRVNMLEYTKHNKGCGCVKNKR
jgi:hypothetical protein